MMVAEGKALGLSFGRLVSNNGANFDHCGCVLMTWERSRYGVSWLCRWPWWKRSRSSWNWKYFKVVSLYGCRQYMASTPIGCSDIRHENRCNAFKTIGIEPTRLGDCVCMLHKLMRCPDGAERNPGSNGETTISAVACGRTLPLESNFTFVYKGRQ